MASSNVVATVVQGHTFTIDTRYQPGKILGRGSFGVVCTAYDVTRHENLAIKRIRPFANDEWDARHTLREIRLMKLLGRHPNIITLYALSVFEEKAELYMVMELMDCDLHRIIQSKQPLNDMHYKCFARQMLEGIKAMHDIGVFHRDLKPGNLLVSKDCQLRITDFGLARFMDDVTLSGNNRQNPLTEYVVTRWYRCPELLLSPNQPYSAAIDIWSIGCIIGELIKRKPLFPGKSHANQVQLILDVRGYNGPADLGFDLSSEASSFLDRRCKYAGKSLASFIPQASPEALELLEVLMDLNPKKRPSATAALEYSYIADAQLLHDYTDAVMPRRVDEKFFDFEREDYSLEELQRMVYEEVARPCDDSIFFSSPIKSSALGRQSSRGGSNPHTSSAESLSNQSASTAGSYNTAGSGSASGHVRTGSDVRQSEGDDSARVEYMHRGHGSTALARSDSTASSEAPLSRGLARSKSAPPSPSPQKMEMIAKQEKKHKRRFFLQGLQRLKQDQQEGSDLGSSRSERETKSEKYGSGPDDLTSRRDRVQPAGVLRGSAVSGSRSKYLQSAQSQSETGAGMQSRDTGKRTKSEQQAHLFSQFTNMGFSRNGDVTQTHPGNTRKLASAPPPTEARTRLPALQNRSYR